MKPDGFGNLTDWGNVLEKLDDIRKSGALGKHQAELVRVFRYKDNWRLTERVLECIKEIDTPGDELIEEACRIMCDEGAYLDMRILAADALGDLLPKRLRQSGETPAFRGVPVIRVMKEVLDSPQAPIFHEAVSKALEAAG